MNFKNIEPQEFRDLIGKEGHVVIDVRGPEELVEGSIPGYKLINMFDASFKAEIDELDKSKTYLIYCRSGSRSGRACAYMESLGFENLYNLSGGIIAWNKSSVVA